MSDSVINTDDIVEDQEQDQTDYKALSEERAKELEMIKKAQSGSDQKVSELSAKIRELELEKLSEKERKEKVQKEQEAELKQLRQEKLRNENKAFAIEHFAKLNIDPELVEIVNLDSDKDKIIESVYALEKVVNRIKEQAIEDYKKDNRPGFKPSDVNLDGSKTFTADQLSELSIKNPTAFENLPDNLKTPAPQKPLFSKLL